MREIHIRKLLERAEKSVHDANKAIALAIKFVERIKEELQ